MKSAMTSFLLGVALFATTDQAKADVKAPEGSHFEVQVEYRTIRWYPPRPGQRSPNIITSHRWETEAGPFQYLSQAVKSYQPLADAADVGKLHILLGYDDGVYRPVAVRLVYVIEGGPLQPDQEYVFDTTRASDE